MYSATLIEMLAESRLAEVAAAAERRGTQHRPEGGPRTRVPLAGNATHNQVTRVTSRALTTVRAWVRALRTSRSTAVETH
jgi:hypothetical protein